MGSYPSADLGYGFVFECEDGLPPAWTTVGDWGDDLDPSKLPTAYEYEEDDFDLGEALDVFLDEQNLADKLSVVVHGNAESGFRGAGVMVNGSTIRCRAYDVVTVELSESSTAELEAIHKAAELLGVAESDIGWRLVISYG